MKPETSTNTADANRVGSTGGSAFTPKLDAEHREYANALIEQIIEDPEKYAFQIVALRDACERAQRYIRGQKKSEFSTGWLWRDECLNAIDAALSGANTGDDPRAQRK